MKAVILAAGKGLRLNGACGGVPKCLLPVGGQTLIARQLQNLSSQGIDDIVVVVGFKARDVRAVCGPRVQIVYNSLFDRTNSLYSLWLARDVLGDGFLVMNSDVLFHPALLNRLINSDHHDAVLVSMRDKNMPPYGDEEMKARVHGDTLIDVSKSMAPLDADGENVGIAKFGSEGARLFVHLMNTLIAAGCCREWVPRVFKEFLTRRPLHVVDTAGYPWIEIDFPEDYHRAVAEVLPMIRGRTATLKPVGTGRSW